MENYSMCGKLVQLLKKGQASYLRKIPENKVELDNFRMWQRNVRS